MTGNSPASISGRAALFALLSATTFYCFWKSRRLRNQKLFLQNPKPSNCTAISPTSSSRRGKLFFVSQTGTSKTLARRLFDLLVSDDIHFDLVDPRDYEPEDLAKETLVLIVASTWEDGKPPPNATFFANWLSESAQDFRVGSLLLSRCNFAVFGVGSRSYEEAFNAVAKDFSKLMKSLGASEILPVCVGDVDGGNLEDVFDVWTRNLIGVLKKGDSFQNGGLPTSIIVNGNESESLDGSDEDDVVEDEAESGIVDLEDIAGKGPSRKSSAVTVTKVEVNGKREMVTPVIRTSLEKQGYKIIGSHSGVKLCRWTKSQLRGRGGCYKHSFYGIV